MADLKTNYKDDILDTSTNTKRKYNMITNADGTVSFEDVTDYSQTGDVFGSSDINATNIAINRLNVDLSQLNSKLEDLTKTQTRIVWKPGLTQNTFVKLSSFTATSDCIFKLKLETMLESNGVSIVVKISKNGVVIYQNVHGDDTFTVVGHVPYCDEIIIPVKKGETVSWEISQSAPRMLYAMVVGLSNQTIY